MKNLLIAITLFLGMQTFSAKGVIPVGTTERLKVVHDLPDTDDYKSETGQYLNLGVLYKTFDVVWMPVWVTADPVLVGLRSDDADIYYNMDPELKKEILTEFKLNEEELLSQLSFWDKYLGLVVVGGLFILYIGYNMLTGNKEDEEQEVA